MPNDISIHHRHSIRLKGYDYSLAGAYFVTMVSQGRTCIFGSDDCGELVLKPAGMMVERWWRELANKFPTISLGAHVTMPNHFHAIISIVGVDLRVDPDPDNDPEGGHAGPPQQCRHTGQQQQLGSHAGLPQQGQPQLSPSLPAIIQWFKTMTTNEYIRGVKQLGWQPFDKRLWQRNYYEHIIRNEDELSRIHAYIESNPAKWVTDSENRVHRTV